MTSSGAKTGSAAGADSGAPAATLTLTGTATDLYLLPWNRIGPGRLQAAGDPDAWEVWRRQVTITRD